MSTSPRVLVIDSQPVMRYGVVMLLSGAVKCEVSAVSDGFAAAAGRVQEERIDLVIADFRIHDETALSFLETLGKSVKGTRCLIYSAMDEVQIGYPCMRAGASGFVSKVAPAIGISGFPRQSTSVRKGEAGSPAWLNKLTSGTFAQP